MIHSDDLRVLAAKMDKLDQIKEWVVTHFGPGPYLIGRTIENSNGETIFEIENTPANSAERLLASLLMNLHDLEK